MTTCWSKIIVIGPLEFLFCAVRPSLHCTHMSSSDEIDPVENVLKVPSPPQPAQILPCCHSQRSADGTEALARPSPPLTFFSLLRHRDATGDRIMHFSWGAERECAGCSSSVWAMFCSVNTLNNFFFFFMIWLLILVAQQNKPGEINHASSWDSFSFQQSDVGP